MVDFLDHFVLVRLELDSLEHSDRSLNKLTQNATPSIVSGLVDFERLKHDCGAIMQLHHGVVVTRVSHRFLFGNKLRSSENKRRPGAYSQP